MIIISINTIDFKLMSGSDSLSVHIDWPANSILRFLEPKTSIKIWLNVENVFVSRKKTDLENGKTVQAKLSVD